MTNRKRLFGGLLILLGLVCFPLAYRAAGTARVSLGVLSAALAAAGIVLLVVRTSPPVRTQQAAFHIPGFTPKYAVKNIALEPSSGRLWIRDKLLGERLLNPDEVVEWKARQDEKDALVWGLELKIKDAAAPVWFSRIGNTPESVDEWSERITAAYRELGRA